MIPHLNDDVLFGEVWNEDAINVAGEDTSVEWRKLCLRETTTN